MRSFGKLTAVPGGRPASATALYAYSTLPGGGGGRGRGRGSGPPTRVPGQPAPHEGDEHGFAPPGVGRGRGQPVLPSSPVLPSFSSWMSPGDPASVGRGRGRFAPSPPPPPPPSDPSESSAGPKKPIFFRREEVPSDLGDKPKLAGSDEVAPLPRSMSPGPSGVGRGKPTRVPESDARPREENRHLRQRPAPRSGPETSAQTASQTRMGREEAVKRAVEVLSRSGGGQGPGRGRGGRTMTRGRGRGRGGRSGGRGGAEEQELDIGIYLGNNADGEKLEKRLGEEKMNLLNEAFEEMSLRALPSPLVQAYLEAQHYNNMIEYEPEYLVNFENPDIDEKPPMSLEEALQKAKPFLMAYEGFQSHEQWEEAVKEIMKKLPLKEELIEMYCGPDVITAKQQQEELERVAKTVPENVHSSVKKFTERAVLSLQSNPGWGFDKKCQFMDKLVREVSQHYK
ncbi:proline-rich protein 12-like [Zingiber officinale]|uniref:Hydroxyproline-rich glycoprotein family protein n=1 Tax=Zingiber officinale TaxID=94328 RepID=A0A8J5FMF9_ZINOF|nr:proline-rich protein 12-like [Zingiber officinale]KAG6487027.1 hypothetical protein ZIOFF_055608 [Zingiber officinale]